MLSFVKYELGFTSVQRQELINDSRVLILARPLWPRSCACTSVYILITGIGGEVEFQHRSQRLCGCRCDACNKSIDVNDSPLFRPIHVTFPFIFLSLTLLPLLPLPVTSRKRNPGVGIGTLEYSRVSGYP